MQGLVKRTVSGCVSGCTLWLRSENTTVEWTLATIGPYF